MTEIFKKADNNELIKHTASIHISNTLTLVSRKISNILLKNAFYDLGNKNTYSIRIADLMSDAGVNSRNYQIIRDSLDILLNTTIKWNIFGKDNKHDWSDKRFVASKMLASIKYDEDSDHVEYSYSEHLKQLFQNPNIYAKLNLLIQKNFKSKHSLALWEFLVEYICSSGKGDYVVTNWIDIASYRKFLGIGKEEYPEFKAMNKYLIKAPIDEVNEISDVKTTVEYQKDGRKVSNIRFHITRQDTKNSIKESKGENTKTETLNIDNPLFVLLTQEYCIGEKSAKGLLQKYSDVQIKSSLDYVDDCRRSTKPPKNLAAYTMKAIENGWEKKISASEKVKITRSVKEQRYHFLCDAIFSFYKELIEYVYSQARIEVTKMSSDAQEALVAQYLQDFVKPADSNQLADMLLIKSRFLDDRHRLSTFYHTVRALQDEFRLNKRAIRDINLCDVWNDSSLVSDVIQNRKDIFESFCRTIDFDIIEYQKELTTLVNDLNSVQNEQIALFVA